MPFVKRTRAILRNAEFGFLGVIVRTWVHTPRFWGAPFGRGVILPLRALKVYRNAGALLLLRLALRPLRTS